MEFFAGGGNYSAHTEALVEKRQGLPLGTLIGFFLSNEEFDLMGKKAADGGFTAGGEDLGLPENLAAEANGYVLLEGIVGRFHFLLHVIYV
jgi:hypothetical protein